MTWHIVCLAGSQDHFRPRLAPGDAVLLVPLDTPGREDAVQTSMPDVFATHGIAPTVAAYDLLRAAIAAYTADVRIARQAAFDGWTRDLTLHLPVQATGWERAAPLLERLLRFLTGDHWQIQMRPAPPHYGPTPGRMIGQRVELATGTVVLFSGGLDSFIGAVDALERGEQVALVGHHAAGQGPTSTSQKRVIAALRETYPAEHTPFLRCWLSPPKGPQRASEATTRGRSVLFLALGVAVASGLPDATLIVPENGFISLNVPLTDSRLGSFSTRTTHPYLVALLREVLTVLAVDVRVDLSYRFRTKGEMLRECAGPAAMRRGLPDTMSCAHPGAGRYTGSRSPNQHCGYCIPCLIRRAAIREWGVDPTPYTWDNLRVPLSPGRGADLRAARLALDGYTQRPARLTDVLKAGPLPGDTADRIAYLDVFRRGLSELRSFLDERT